MTESGPIGDDAFAGLMAPLGPFGPAPAMAVAVSGGADSLALAVLLHDWTRARGGSLVALTVDHGLRADSAAEARRVGEVLGGLGIRQVVLTWHGAKPTANVQAEARAARYDLLNTWCARHGWLHLALAHHRDDQAETLLLRLGRGSGLDGLAGMSAVICKGDLCLIRPFLTVPKSTLEITLRNRGIPWIEDPSNRDPRHARVRIRARMPALDAEGLTPPRLAATAAHLGRARNAIESQVAGLLARAASLHPAGFLWLDPGLIAEAPADVGLRAVSRALLAVGGRDYAPRLERLERLFARVRSGLTSGATLGGCRILPRKRGLLLVREAQAVPTVDLGPRTRTLWDGRFDVVLGATRAGAPARLSLGPLGAENWRDLVAKRWPTSERSRRAAPVARTTPVALTKLSRNRRVPLSQSPVDTIPRAVMATLPAFRDDRGLYCVPQLDYWRLPEARKMVKKCQYAPKNALTLPGFTVAYPAGHIIS